MQPVGVSGSLSALQGTSPWQVSGTVSQADETKLRSTVFQGTSPWVISGSQTLTVQGAVGGQAVSVSGTITSLQGTTPWQTSGTVSQADATKLLATVVQGTSPWVVSSSLVQNITGTVVVVQGNGQADENPSPWQFQLADTHDTDAFHRLRVSQPLSLFSSKLLYDNQPQVWDQQFSGSGGVSTFLSSSVSNRMSVTGSVAGSVIRQSFRRMHYQPGKSQSITLTGILCSEGGTGVAGVYRNIGPYDQDNGFFFQLSGTNVNTVVRSKASGVVVDTVVSKSAWSEDHMDGTGHSRINLDPTKGQLFGIDYQWLSEGRTRFGLTIDGDQEYVHYHNVANHQTGPSTANPNLPIRYEIGSDGTGPATVASMDQVCAAVISEGGQENIGISYAVDTGGAVIQTDNSTSTYPLLAFQFRSGRLNAAFRPETFSVSTTNATVQFKVLLFLNPTVTSPFSFSGIPTSTMQFATGSGTGMSISGGTKLFSNVYQLNKASSVTDQLPTDLTLGSDITGSSQTLVLAVQCVPAPGSTVNWVATMNFLEQV